MTGLTLDLGHPVQANAYLTPAVARGFAPHYDTHDVFVIQLAGSKHWTVHPPTLEVESGLDEWTQHRDAVAAAATEPPAYDGILEPGDVLYLPRGWIHLAQAGAETSLHLTLGIHPYTERHVLDAVVAEALDRLRIHGSLPVGIDVADPGSLEQVVDSVRRSLTDSLTTVKVEAVARRMAARRDRDVRPAAVRPVAQVRAAGSQHGGAPVPVVLRTGAVPRVSASADGVSLVVDGRTLGFPVDHLAAVRAVTSGARISADQLPKLGDTEGRDLVRRLLLAGVVVPADS